MEVREAYASQDFEWDQLQVGRQCLWPAHACALAAGCFCNAAAMLPILCSVPLEPVSLFM